MIADEFPPEPAATASKLQWATWLAAVGRISGAFKVFPCLPDDGSVDEGGKPFCKRPRIAGWQKLASWDGLTVETMWLNSPNSNTGLAIQPGFVAIDADLYKPGHAEKLAAYEAENGTFPETMEFESANGGVHLIYKTERTLGNSAGSLPGFGDVRGFGGYLVGPGSTINGRPYTVIDGAVHPAPLPEHVDKHLVSRRSGERKGSREGVDVDDPLNVARFITWLRRDAKPSIQGQRGNDTLAHTGAMGWSYALSEDTALSLMVEHWNERCQPEWDLEALAKHGGSGYRTAQSDFGNMAQISGFKDWTKLDQPRTDDIFRTAADIADIAAPVREWAVGSDADGWIPLGGLTFLYGAGGVGKTALVGQLCIALARGEPLFGTLPVRQMPTLFIAAEDELGELHRRFKKQGIRKTDNVTFASVDGLETALHPSFRKDAIEDTWLYNIISHRLATMPAGPKFLVLDNLAQMYMGNYYEPSEITRFLNQYLRRLCKQHDATGLVLAHPSENQKTSGDGGYGGVQWSNGLRARLYFERHMTTGYPARGGKPAVKPKAIGRERVLSRKKANYADDGERGIVLDWSDYSFVPVTSSEGAAAKATAELTAADHGFTDQTQAQDDPSHDGPKRPPKPELLLFADRVENLLLRGLLSGQAYPSSASLQRAMLHEDNAGDGASKQYEDRLKSMENYGHPAFIRNPKGNGGKWQHHESGVGHLRRWKPKPT